MTYPKQTVIFITAKENKQIILIKGYLKMTNKYYLNLTTGEETTSASAAFKWHKSGHALHVVTGDINPYRVFVRGAEQPHKISSRDENSATCECIAYECEMYADGEYSRCPECGEQLYMCRDEIGDKYKCPTCGAVNDVDDYEQCSLYDYFADMLDIDWIIDSNKEYKACRIMMACGGPNIYINTWDKQVELYWWTESAKYPLSYQAVESINEWAEEYWMCTL